ncbi:K+/H+ antiporter subunit F [Paracoccus yeei]|jgi:multicomponent K+:H+ antiporter subunit F|uniref:K+/H+ antiporter subunit F n=2 Tax=Paracoccus TaxID=265 RepID=A0A1V0GWI9_9RHOB|nr:MULTISPECIES: K+/H+ antiporter subunit F [Paracoccus]ARC38188.1 K+/H+ antiporter subunit F [Paracoccus yeei]ATQ56948.1 K+/H+ antiporter subunit F [Paracoccus yeei]AWX94194.1 K+/H+ antiporter subunit F [Paracoccus mutanolyticus]AYF01047.1 Na+/H+ antiporter subunit F [Paracoccus yeei]MBY0137015.1 K+/H+ antiporter subunit F [Paracoccus yeei]
MSALILEYALTYAQIAMVLALGLACWRMLRGPRAQDRVLGLDTMYFDAMLLFLLIGMGNGNVFFFEGALVIAVLGFVTTVCAAKFLMRGEVIE